MPSRQVEYEPARKNSLQLLTPATPDAGAGLLGIPKTPPQHIPTFPSHCGTFVEAQKIALQGAHQKRDIVDTKTHASARKRPNRDKQTSLPPT